MNVLDNLISMSRNKEEDKSRGKHRESRLGRYFPCMLSDLAECCLQYPM